MVIYAPVLSDERGVCMKQVAVSGSTGFIGQHLCDVLLKQVVGLRVLGRRNTAISADFCHWDISEPLNATALDGVDTVFHLAAKVHALSAGQADEESYFCMNVAATRSLLEAAKAAGVRRFIYFSTVKAVAEPGEKVVDELDQSLPESAYGRSKRMAEGLVLDGNFVPEPVVLRPTMVYGATETGNLPRMIKAIQQGYFPRLPNLGNKRSMIHVDDVVQAAMLAATRPEAVGNVYILSDGAAYDIQQMYAWICDALEKPQSRYTCPLLLLRSLAYVGDVIGKVKKQRFMFDSDVLDKLIGASMYSSKKIEQDLGFFAQRSLRTAMSEVVEYCSRLYK